MVEAKFFESLLLLGVGFLVPRTPSFELHLAPPEKLTHPVGVRILNASLAQEPMGLRDRGDLTPFHSLFKLFEGFLRNQLLTATFVYSAFEQLLETTVLVVGKPPLALAPRVAQSVRCLSQVGAFP